jgi:hypothetical protein
MTLQGKYYLELFQSPSTNELEVMVHKSKERALKSRDECTINIIEVDIDELKHTPAVVGRSEQFYCASDKDYRYERCEEQCHLCKMDY